MGMVFMVYSWLGASPKSSPKGKDLMKMVFLLIEIIVHFLLRWLLAICGRGVLSAPGS